MQEREALVDKDIVCDKHLAKLADSVDRYYLYNEGKIEAEHKNDIVILDEQLWIFDKYGAHQLQIEDEKPSKAKDEHLSLFPTQFSCKLVVVEAENKLEYDGDSEVRDHKSPVLSQVQEGTHNFDKPQPESVSSNH